MDTRRSRHVLGRVMVMALSLLALAGCMANPSRYIDGAPDKPEVRGQWSDSAVTALSGSRLRIANFQADVEVVLHRVADDPQWLLSEQRRISRDITHRLNTAVVDLGLTLIPLSPETDSVTSDRSVRRATALTAKEAAETRFQASRLMDTHARLASIGDNVHWPALGNRVLPLSEPLNADLILVSRYRGWKKTDGQWRKERVSSTLSSFASLGLRQARSQKEFGELEMLLLNGVNGELVWRGYIAGVPDAVIQSIPSAIAGCWKSDC